jgi:hypothetical protein
MKNFGNVEKIFWKFHFFLLKNVGRNVRILLIKIDNFSGKEGIDFWMLKRGELLKFFNKNPLKNNLSKNKIFSKI